MQSVPGFKDTFFYECIDCGAKLESGIAETACIQFRSVKINRFKTCNMFKLKVKEEG